MFDVYTCICISDMPYHLDTVYAKYEGQCHKVCSQGTRKSVAKQFGATSSVIQLLLLLLLQNVKIMVTPSQKVAGTLTQTRSI